MTSFRATYRLQLRAGVTFRDARRLLQYLRRLGVSHLYLSPVFTARRGSEHGYDVVDPRALDPAVGREGELRRLAQEARTRGMGLLLDIVPNHLATSSENPYWSDVLTHGASSAYAQWFDVDWGARGDRRVFLPVLGDRLARVLERGEVRLEFTDRRWRVRYYEQEFPVDPRTIPLIVEGGAAARDAAWGGTPATVALGNLTRDLRALPPRWPRHPARREEAERLLKALWDLAARSAEVRRLLTRGTAALAPEQGGVRRLARLLRGQAYRLAYWRRAAREINYRRFFTISHLIGVRVEDPTVFAATHQLALDWCKEGIVAGLRVDHVDGLHDPASYLKRLHRSLPRRGLRRRPAVVVEKILARHEELPPDWPVDGTTGYEFLNEVEDLFIDPAGYAMVEAAYRALTGQRAGYHAVARRAKRSILTGHLAADVRRLARMLGRLSSATRGPVPDMPAVERAIVETIVELPRYRVYPGARPPWYRRDEREVLAGALERAGKRASRAAVELLAYGLLLREPRVGSAAERSRRLAFARRFQQVCGPAAAKGVEDTALYRYVPLASRNEVGGEPDAPLDDAVGVLHTRNARRVRRWAGGLLAVSTHDTKRSADVRGRLDVLSEVPQEWLAGVRRWRRWNREHRRRVGGRLVPDPGVEYLLYQSLVGLWPLRGDVGSASGLPAPTQLGALRTRIGAYLLKAAREAKRRTSWVRPHPPYEEALAGFVERVLSPATADRFLADVAGFVRRIVRPGLWNALSRTLVHLTAPGVPDVYQGDELWNFTLVDPDNRQPVDFRLRGRLLQQVAEVSARSTQARRRLLGELLSLPEDGRIKLYVLHRALDARRRMPELFAEGRYVSLPSVGPAARHVFAFARTRENTAVVVVVPRLVVSLSGDSRNAPVTEAVWGDTAVRLPAALRLMRWRSLLTGQRIAVSPGRGTTRLQVADAFGSLPLALLEGRRPT
jgi:(1->4)-alpha-D-glucan 1-alpha-D-glucosylmutase